MNCCQMGIMKPLPHGRSIDQSEWTSAVLIALATAAVFSVLAMTGIELTRANERVPALWLSNALLAGVLLRTRASLLPIVAGTCFLANILVNISFGDDIITALVLSSANIFEAILFVEVIGKYFGRQPSVGNLRVLAGLLAASMIVPALSGVIAGFGVPMNGNFDGQAYRIWVISDGLGLMIVTPLTMIVMDGWRSRRRPGSREIASLFLLVALSMIISLAVFWQGRYPLLFVLMPVIVIGAFMHGRAGAVFTAVTIGIVATASTIMGHGPISLVADHLATRMLVLQAFLATSFAVGLPVATILAARDSMREALRDTQDFTTLMLNNVPDVIFRTDHLGRWTYLNPAWSAVTGRDADASLGTSSLSLLSRAERAEALRLIRQMAAGTISQFAFRPRIVHPSGEHRHFEVRAHRLTDQDGKFVGAAGSIRDISSDIHRQFELAEGERRFRRLAEAAPVGIFRTGPDGDVSFVNTYWCDQLGVQQEDLLGGRWSRFVIDDQMPDAGKEPAAPLRPGEVRTRTLRLRTATGSEIWASVISAGEFHENGELSGIIGVVTDITEQRLQSEALIRSERRFQTLADLSPAGIFRTDRLGNCSYVNAAWMQLTGFTDDSWKDDGWATALHPDDAERIASGWARAVAERVDYRDEWRWVRGDGSISWVLGLGRPDLDEQGGVVGFVGVTIDITQRRAAEAALADREAQLSLLAVNATDAVLRLDLGGNCIYASPSVRRILGIEADALINADIRGLIHPEDVAAVEAGLKQLSGGLREQTVVSCRIQDRDAEDGCRWLEASCGAVLGEDQQPAGIIASIRDISQTKKLEHDLRVARDSAEQATAAKSSFLAHMSHEIRTPMNGVLGFVDLLSRSPLSEEQARHVASIAESGHAMMRLLNDILDISKIEAGYMTVSREPVDLLHKVNSCVSLMKPVAEAKGLELTLEFDAGLSRYIVADPLRTRQVVLNLVGNAVKFTEQGSVSIIVWKDVRDGRPHVRVDVRDTGVGISADLLPLVFQKFVQVDPSAARRFGGAGLGLAISGELAHLMGGTIEVASEIGKGSTFTFWLPLQEADAPAAEIAADQPPRPDGRVLAGRPRVLVAEDNRINQMLMIALAKSADIDPVIAANGQEAVDIVERAHAEGAAFDLVLMDMQMPVVDGIEATRRLRANGFSPDRLPIVALTANAFDGDVQACLNAGMQGHLSKPIGLDDLKTAITRFARRVAA